MFSTHIESYFNSYCWQYNNVTKRNCDGVPSVMVVSQALCSCSWLVYGYLINDPNVAVSWVFWFSSIVLRTDWRSTCSYADVSVQVFVFNFVNLIGWTAITCRVTRRVNQRHRIIKRYQNKLVCCCNVIKNDGFRGNNGASQSANGSSVYKNIPKFFASDMTAFYFNVSFYFIYWMDCSGICYSGYF